MRNYVRPPVARFIRTVDTGHTAYGQDCPATPQVVKLIDI